MKKTIFSALALILMLSMVSCRETATENEEIPTEDTMEQEEGFQEETSEEFIEEDSVDTIQNGSGEVQEEVEDTEI
ncbi:hypothetical protein [Autumnicola musiva]|uniref:Secreted protein n=1 Tax=Autumnicola musiva TaxID=3075589 RepID=A0ABU3D5L2_9FLAO|nr:hypothetical protein [Zunongwangia sp. F117]MDT0676669.1 hypothetical protein [Zunongwangia sp. F117]